MKEIPIEISFLLNMLKLIDYAPFELFDNLHENNMLSDEVEEIESADLAIDSNFVEMFLESIEHIDTDLLFIIAEKLGMPKYSKETDDCYEYIPLLFMRYCAEEITEEEFIEAVKINAKDSNFIENKLFLKAIGDEY